MAAALYSSQNGPQPSTPLMNELDFRDNRYPSIAAHSFKSTRDQATSSSVLMASSGWEPEEKETSSSNPPRRSSPSRNGASDVQSLPEPSKSAVSYSLPQNNRRVVERYSLDNDATQQEPTPQQKLPSHQDMSPSLIPAAPRHPSLPLAGIGAGPSNTISSASPVIIPLSASPTYTPPISTKQRAYPQQPTYIQNVSPNPVNPVYLPNNPPAEEICIECAMRDQDMADVDVTSPGVWDRESDIYYEELKRKEAEEEASGIINTEGPPRPKATGGQLTESNLKLWLSVNPREPTSRQQTLNSYIKTQRTLLEAEALARARALHEAKELDNRMRDTYSQLRRSAYDTGNSASPADDMGGVRIKPPTSPAVASFPPRAHDRSHSRDVTLLENGMIVEHVDVRKEEREAKDRRRKDERRARKSSRSSAVDVNSLMSTHSLVAPQTDSGVGLKPYSRYSQASSARPLSVLTAPLDRPDLPRALSQASFSDVQSLGSPSPRRRFFGVRSSYWRSQDSLAMSGVSGSMMDMHVALQREGNRAQLVQSPVDVASGLHRQTWPSTELAPIMSRQSEEKPQKKKKGLAKIWRLVTRSGKNESSSTRGSQSLDRNEDDSDYPLAPPPPLSYLVNRGSPGDRMGPRHASTPSLPLTSSPKLAPSSTTGISPPTAPSTALPSPASSRQSGADQDTAEARKVPIAHTEDTEPTAAGLFVVPPNVHSPISEPDLRRVSQTAIPIVDVPIDKQHLSQTVSSRLTISTLSREKSLPPLPNDAAAVLRPYVNGNARDSSRPRTVYTFDSRPPGTGAPHDFVPPQAAFRTDARRQSFGGLASRPNLSGFLSRSANGRPQRGMGSAYDEFGASRGSLRLPSAAAAAEPNARQSVVLTGTGTGPTPTKRRSRFGLSSLLGKKKNNGSSPERARSKDVHESQYQAYGGTQQQQQQQQFPAIHTSGSDVHDEVMTGYATSNSRHSALSGAGGGGGGGGGAGPRMSITSRKALDELVSQDAEFVAYRYPSNDQRLDLLR
ncbi:hypothetical protein F5878DRAFT_599249 [Lentinula raphanica]|uniref:Proteophosphoglycan ppg4 n=1 Tax=Lentinula raphanica TaxID=153919 RepID=A0AA38UNL3_9AGAR|nr:hypothetical protein F5878DRAFT_599249 [Lentinula raphanica]